MKDRATTAPEFIKAPDLPGLLQPSFTGHWVALSHDYSKITASADSVNGLLKKLSAEEKTSDPIFYKVPNTNSYYMLDNLVNRCYPQPHNITLRPLLLLKLFKKLKHLTLQGFGIFKIQIHTVSPRTQNSRAIFV